MSEPWRFTGSIWEFVDLVQWVLVVWQAGENNHPDRMKVLTDDAVSDRVAAEYGITPYSVAAEMKRIAPKVMMLLEAVVKHKTNEEGQGGEII